MCGCPLGVTEGYPGPGDFPQGLHQALSPSPLNGVLTASLACVSSLLSPYSPLSVTRGSVTTRLLASPHKSPNHRLDSLGTTQLRLSLVASLNLCLIQVFSLARAVRGCEKGMVGI